MKSVHVNCHPITNSEEPLPSMGPAIIPIVIGNDQNGHLAIKSNQTTICRYHIAFWSTDTEALLRIRPILNALQYRSSLAETAGRSNLSVNLSKQCPALSSSAYPTLLVPVEHDAMFFPDLICSFFSVNAAAQPSSSSPHHSLPEYRENSPQSVAIATAARPWSPYPEV